MEKTDIAVVVSKNDSAGMNIAEQLQKLHRFPAIIGNKRVGLFFREEHVTEPVGIDKEINADAFIFASRHVSKAGIHSLSVHSIGNWAKAIGGGKDMSLVGCPAALMKSCFRILVQKAGETGLDYEVVQEATHHGPYLEKPSMFIEIGSDEGRWRDKRAGKAVASAIIEAVRAVNSSNDEKIKTVVGLGGLHYASNFRKIMLSDNVAVAYLCPKHVLESLGEEMLRQAMEKSIPKAGTVVLDWKGLGKEKTRILELLKSIGMRYERTRDFA